MTAAPWITFDNERRTPSRLTCIWDVNTRDGTPLGEVRWYASWRCYVFIPRSGSLYEQDCLREIAAFCERQTNLNKQLARNRREQRSVANVVDPLDGCDICSGAHASAQHLAHDARQVTCREASCRKPIVMLKNPKTGKHVPVDGATVAPHHDHYDRELGHVSHFLTCTKPNQFGKGRR